MNVSLATGIISFIIFIPLFIFGIISFKKGIQLFDKKETNDGKILISGSIGLLIFFLIYGLGTALCMNGESYNKKQINIEKSAQFGHEYYDTSKSYHLEKCEKKGFNIKNGIIFGCISVGLSYLVLGEIEKKLTEKQLQTPTKNNKKRKNIFLKRR